MHLMLIGLYGEPLERADCLEWNYHLEILSEAWLQLGFKGPLKKKKKAPLKEIYLYG